MPAPKSFAHALRIALDRMCIDYGYCLPPAVTAAMIADPPEDALSLTKAVIVAEGLNPEQIPRSHYRYLLAVAEEAYAFRIDEDE